MSQEMSDLHKELRATKTVRASVLTFAMSVYQRMSQALEAVPVDLAALHALRYELGPDHREALAGAVIGGTSIDAEDRDVDPNAPPKASNPASLGGNVYGSKGPEDQPLANQNTSLGYAGRDAIDTKAGRPLEDDVGGHGNGGRMTAAPEANRSIPEQVEGEQNLKRDERTYDPSNRGEMGFAPGGPDIQKPGARSATEVGETRVQQDIPSYGRDGHEGVGNVNNQAGREDPHAHG